MPFTKSRLVWHFRKGVPADGDKNETVIRPSTPSPPASALSFDVPESCIQTWLVEKAVHGWCPDCDWAHAKHMGWLGKGGKVRAWGPAGSGWGG